MGTISEKLTYLNETKQELKQAINNLGGSITDETTFRQYVNQLDGVYDVLPKTEFQEGTEVTIENGLKGKIDFDDGKVGFGQASQESTQGYQLLNVNFTNTKVNGIDFTNSNQVVGIKGTTTASANIEVGRATLPSGNYIITCSNIPYAWGTSRVEVSGTGIDTLSFFSGNTQKQLTLSQETTIIFRAIVSGTGTSVDYSTTIMLESGSTAHDWEQYTGGYASPSPNWEQPIQCVTGNQDVVVSGKNLLEAKLNTVTNNGITVTNNNDGTFTINGTNTSTSVVTFRLDEPNFHTYEDGTYTLDKGTTNTDIFIRLMQNETWAQIITVSYEERLKSQAITNATNTFIYIGIKGSATINNVTIKPMFVKGSYTVETIGNFEPYITPTSYQLSLGDIELNAIGNYKDELIYDVENDKVYKNETIGEYLLTGQETIYKDTPNNRFELDNLVDCLHLQARSQIYCNRYPFLASGNADYGMFTYWNGAITQVFVYDKDQQYPSNLQNYFANNETYFCYIRNTPILKELTDTTLINQVKALYNAHSNNGTTIITSNGNLPMIIKVRALKGE